MSQTNPPVGPAHIWYPHGAPTRRVPRAGVYAIGLGLPRYLRWRERF